MDSLRVELVEVRANRDEAQQSLLSVSESKDSAIASKQAEVDWLVEEVI